MELTGKIDIVYDDHITAIYADGVRWNWAKNDYLNAETVNRVFTTLGCEVDSHFKDELSTGSAPPESLVEALGPILWS